MLFPQSEHRDDVCVRLYRVLKDRIPPAKTVPPSSPPLRCSRAYDIKKDAGASRCRAINSQNKFIAITNYRSEFIKCVLIILKKTD